MRERKGEKGREDERITPNQKSVVSCFLKPDTHIK